MRMVSAKRVIEEFYVPNVKKTTPEMMTLNALNALPSDSISSEL